MAHFVLFLQRGRAEDLSSLQLSEPQERPSHGPTHRMNEDLLTGCDVSNTVQHLIRRNPIEDQGDRSPPVNSIKHRHQIFFGEVDQLRLPFVLRKTCDAITDLEL